MGWLRGAFGKRGVSLMGLFMVSMLLTVLLCLPTVAATARHYTELKFQPLPEVQVPKYSRFVLDNGLVVYLMEDRELPLVEGTALFRTGARWEAAEKVGLTTLVGTVMRTGGTQGRSADDLNQLLEERAAAVERRPRNQTRRRRSVLATRHIRCRASAAVRRRCSWRFQAPDGRG